MRSPSTLALVVGMLAAIAACHGRAAPGDAPRVVSLHDVTTEIVVALGATGRLVAMAPPVDATPAVEGATAGVASTGGA
ncbi:MAG: hypothetical protein K8M05_08375, partial [Deltaproteobacteria bacterium]|nr:hypothetical protein [Kofleriaceae bacterium]